MERKSRSQQSMAHVLNDSTIRGRALWMTGHQVPFPRYPIRSEVAVYMDGWALALKPRLGKPQINHKVISRLRGSNKPHKPFHTNAQPVGRKDI